MSPIVLIIVMAGVVIAGMALLFWPGKGVMARLGRARAQSSRSAIEDVLKHAYDCQSRSVACTIESIAGVLQTSTGDATRLVSRLESMGLLAQEGSGLTLTADGTSYALRVIRIHRLWERYLADETSVREADWHREAERQEHRLSVADADALAARLSNPQVDPHGDPIPSATGEIPSIPGSPLTALAEGEFGQIVHIEDEPPEMYAQLVAHRLHLGMQLQVMESSPQRVRFEAEGEEVLLAPQLARSITVTVLPEERRAREPFLTLASIPSGETATVTSISRACRGQQRRRIMDLGIVPGTRITPELDSLTGDPRAYQVRGTLVALRKEQANQIFVQPGAGAA
jgi:DtxR family Mn-dependent transcriptional regulator